MDLHANFSVPETDESNSSAVVSDSDLSFVPSSQAVTSSSPSKKFNFTQNATAVRDNQGVVEESSDDSVVDVSQAELLDNNKFPLGKLLLDRNKITSNSGSSMNSSTVDDTCQSLSSSIASPKKFTSLSTGASKPSWRAAPYGLSKHQHDLDNTPTLDPGTSAGRWRDSVISSSSDEEQESLVHPLSKSDVNLPELESGNELEYLLQKSNHSSSKMSTPKHFLTNQRVSDRNTAGAREKVATAAAAMVDRFLVSPDERKNEGKKSIVISSDSLVDDERFEASPIMIKHKRIPRFVIDSDDDDDHHDSSTAACDITVNDTTVDKDDDLAINEDNVQPQQEVQSAFRTITDTSLEDEPNMSSAKYRGKYVIKEKSPCKTEPPSSAKLNNDSVIKNSRADDSFEKSKSSHNATNSSVEEIQLIIDKKRMLVKTVDLHKLPDKGERIMEQISELEKSLSDLSMNSSIHENSVSLADSREQSILTVNSSSETESPKTKLSGVKTKLSDTKTKLSDAKTIPFTPSNVYRYEPPPSFSPEKHTASKQENAKDKIADIKETLAKKKTIFKATNLRHLADNGERMKKEIMGLERELMMIELNAGPTVIRKDTPPKYEQKPLEKLPSMNATSVSKDEACGGARYLQPNMPQHVIDALYAAEHNYGGRDYGGKLSHAREREMVRVTSDTLEHFTDMIKSMPDVDNLDPNEVQEPRGLKVDLMPHQKRALAWLLWRESQDPPGGILADDMGLGKTLTMLSLILRHRELLKEGIIQDFAMQSLRDEDEDEESVEKAHGWLARSGRQKLKKTQSTLVVCPASLIGQWEGEAHQRVSGSRLSVLVYHGTKRDTSLSKICQHDVVVTTYQLAMKEAFGKGGCSKKEKNSDGIPKVIRSNQGSLYQIGWARIILDEAHIIRNHKSQTAQAMCMLKGGRRWVVTGTPVQNKEKDVFSLIRFLRIVPFDDYTCWKHQIENGGILGIRRLNMIVKAVLLRRTKDQVDQVTGEQLVKLPEKKVVEHKLSLSQEERQIYDRVFTFSKNSLCEYMKSHEQKEMEKEAKTRTVGKVPVVEANQFTPTLNLSNFVDSGIKTHHLLVLLLRLRQICCHPTLIKAVSSFVVCLAVL
ncbi:SNF2-related N-terminal domain [Trinorchestia longiramus]|nr:SNF2-related N-terminal domain [Trinorchestia longiramus]